jgi:peptidoglycan/LPS O-acetylase OafA/YrhL
MQRQIHVLTSLRFFAAFSVVLFHFRESFGEKLNLGIAGNFISRGYMWVDFFFILSGFIIAYMYQEQFSRLSLQVYGRFLINRIARIYPAYVFVLGLFLAWESLTYILVQFYGFSALPFDGCLSPATFATNLLMVHDWGGWFGNCSWNYPAWSISSEWLVYLLFPMTLLVFKFSNEAVPALLASVILYILFLIFALDDGMSFQSTSGNFRVLVEFSIGILTFRIYLKLNQLMPSKMCNIMFLGVIIGAVAGIHLGLSDGLILPLLAGIVLFAAMMKDGFVHRALSVRWLVFLGEASYSVYLIHAFDQRVWNSITVRLFNGTFSVGMTYFFFFTIMAGIVMSGVLVYVLVEKPSRRWIQKRWVKGYE